MLYGIKDVANLHVRKTTSNDVVAYQPHANVSTNTWTSDRVYANSKGTRAIPWDYNKQGTLKVEMEVFDLIWMSILAGRDWTKGAVDVWTREVLTTSASNTVTLSDTPVTGTLGVFLVDADGESNGVKQTVGTPASNPNEYSIATDTVTLNATTAPEGTKIIVYYSKASEATAEQLRITATDFPESYHITGDIMIRPKKGVDQFFQMDWKNARPMPNFEITLDSSSPTNLSVEFDLFPDENGDLATYTRL